MPPSNSHEVAMPFYAFERQNLVKDIQPLSLLYCVHIRIIMANQDGGKGPSHSQQENKGLFSSEFQHFELERFSTVVANREDVAHIG